MTALRKNWHRFVQFVDGFSIRSKLFGYAFMMIALMLILGALVYNRIGEIRSQHLPARAAARDMEAALLTMQTHELSFIDGADSLNAEFYLKHSSTHINSWQEHYRIFEANYTKLVEIFGDKDESESLNKIKPLITKYRDTFFALNGAYRERGFQAFGREGVLWQRAGSLEENLADEPKLLAQFLKTQEAQNKFLLYRQPTSIAEFHTQAQVLAPQLRSADDRTLFDEYVRLFEDVTAIYQKIGLASSDGLRGELNKITRAIAPHIQTTESFVLDSTSKSITSIAQSITYTIFLLSALSIFIAVILARLILGKIALLSEASRQIADGNLTYRLPIQVTDELGQLSQSFNHMAEELQKGRRALRVRAHELSQSVKRFELISRAVNEAVYEWDIPTGRLTWGEGLVKVFGYRPTDKMATIEWWGDRIHPEDADSINESLERQIRRGAEGWKKEYRFKRASGEYAYCQDRGFIEYQNSEAIRMVGSIVDVSKQKALDRAKDEFISVASHQLRTPLGSIRWNLELLLEKKKALSKDHISYLDEAYNSTIRMTGLVSDLLSVARIEQDRVQNIPEKTDLVEITEAAITEMLPIAQHHGVRIESDGLKNKHTSLIIDPKRYREVVQNLLSNAVKYTPSKGRVIVSLEQCSKDFVVSISDNGIGIPLEDQTKMFSKFYRASNVTATDTEGSGLGLFVVRSYVESWGGRVWFESKMNQGTTFYVSIPYKPRIPK